MVTFNFVNVSGAREEKNKIIYGLASTVTIISVKIFNVNVWNNEISQNVVGRFSTFICQLNNGMEL